MSAFKAFGRICAELVPGGDALSLDMADVMAALERARVVGVLDGWAAREAGSYETIPATIDGGNVVKLSCLGWLKNFKGATPDEARAKAAAAIEAGEV